LQILAASGDFWQQAVIGKLNSDNQQLILPMAGQMLKI
jgi:hypothetical protein